MEDKSQSELNWRKKYSEQRNQIISSSRIGLSKARSIDASKINTLEEISKKQDFNIV